MLTKWLLAPCSDLGILVLRVGFGLSLFLGHGLMKVQNWNIHSFMDPIGIGPELTFILAVFAEALCALLIVVGLFTRAAAIPLVILFVVIHVFVMVNVPTDPVAANNFYMTKEIARLFLIGFGSILIMGPGKYSFDHVLFRKKA